MTNLQRQGVPFPDRLNGPQVRGSSGKRFKESGGSPAPRPRAQNQIARRNSAGSGRSSGVRAPSFGSQSGGGNSGASVGALEAEFLVAILILILLLFANNTTPYTERMMSFIKRGALICLAFFVLALISGIGSRASKVAVAFGALIIVAMFVTSPVGTVIKDVDSLIKNKWVGTEDLGPNAPTSQDSGSKPGTPVSFTTNALEKLAGAAVGTPAFNAFTAEIRAAKSGQIWKVPADAAIGLEDLGKHTVSGAWDKLKSVLHWLHL